jgi:hypothetical protein
MSHYAPDNHKKALNSIFHLPLHFSSYTIYHVSVILTDYRHIFLCSCSLAFFFYKSDGWACVWRPYGKLQDFRWTSSIFFTAASLQLHYCDSQSALRHHPPSCSCCLNAIYLAITEAPLTATLTFNLENCLALVVCFHYCQLFRSLCWRSDSLYHTPRVAGLQWRFHALSVQQLMHKIH